MSGNAVLFAPDAVSAHPRAGGKARGLAALANAGFDVPPWFVVLPALSGSGGAAAGTVGAEMALDINDRPDFTSGDAVQRQLDQFPDNARFAVRSSADAEDGATASFAGQYESFLNVARADVQARIEAVRASANSARVAVYRIERGLDPASQPAPAVVVQQMVDPIAAGVAFSADPAGGARDLCVISAVPGLADKLVSGEAPADTWHVERSGAIARYSSRNSGATPLLGEHTIRAIADLARRVADTFGPAQDIEWAVDTHGIWLLQSRPITTLDAVPDPSAAPGLWDNSNIAESYSGIVAPLTFSFARSVYEEVYRQFCRINGIRAERVDAARAVFANMLGYLQGRIYYNLPNWYRVLAMLPGYRSNRAYMEQMMGVGETLPPALESVLKETTKSRGLADRLSNAFDTARSVCALGHRLLSLSAAEKRFYRRLDKALNPPSRPMTELRLDELAAQYRSLEGALLRRWDTPIVNDFFAMIFFGLLRKVCTAWCGDDGDRLAPALVAGTGEVISAEPVQRIAIMGACARTLPDADSILLKGTRKDCEHFLAANAVLAGYVEEYIKDFGERTAGELKLETETLADDPLPLYRAIGRAAGYNPPATVLRNGEDAGREAVAALRSSVWRPLRAAILPWIVHSARARLRARENLRFQRTRVFGRVRRLFVEMGRRLAFENRLETARDVFYLSVEEVLGFVEGTAASWDLRGLAAVRRAEHERWKTLPPPAGRIETRGAPALGNAFTPAPAPARATEEPGADGAVVLEGVGCSPGVVRGRVRVVIDPQTVALEPGEILVALRTDPGWILLFPAASGLLVEFGSLLSHSAIVSRELGLPAVVSIPDLTSRLATGDEVELDGGTGLVRLIKRG